MKKMLGVGAVVLAGCCCVCERGPRDFGTTKYGEKAHLYTL